MLRYGLSAALICFGGTAFAQAAASPAPAPNPPTTAQMTSLQTSALAFGQCVMSGVQGVPASATPEAGATRVLAGCATQREQLDQAAEAYIATLPEEGKATAREQYRAQMAMAQTQIAARITQLRAAPAASAAPAQ